MEAVACEQAVAVCEALGLPPEQVSMMTIHIEPPGLLRFHLTYVPTERQGERVAGILREGTIVFDDESKRIEER